MSYSEMMQMMFPDLTNGTINRILDGEDVANAVIQILGYEKIDCVENYLYSLLISDGVTGSPFALLESDLNHLITNKELEEFAIVQVNRCTCEKIVDGNVIILLRLTVVVPGNEVNEKLGNPVIPTAVNTEEMVSAFQRCIKNLGLKLKKEQKRLIEENHRRDLETLQLKSTNIALKLRLNELEREQLEKEMHQIELKIKLNTLETSYRNSELKKLQKKKNGSKKKYTKSSKRIHS